MGWTIRSVGPADAAEVVGILNPIIEAGGSTVFTTPFSVEQERRYIEGLPERGLFLAAFDVESGRMAGFQTMEPFGSYTRAFDHVGVMGTYVAEEFRRRGVARALFSATFEAARRAGYEKVFTFVRADNAPALGAYLSQGFAVIGTAKKQAKIGGRYVDEVLIEKWLG